MRRRPLNCNLYTIEPLQRVNPLLVAAILNSSPVILAKHLFGRPAGVEGNLKTEIVDVDMMPIPDWTLATPALRRRLALAMRTMSKRPAIGLLSPRRLRRKSLTERGYTDELLALSDDSELNQADRRMLDDAVLELLGVAVRAERTRLLDALYAHLRQYFENVRVKEEEAIDNKRRAASQATLGVDQIVGDVMQVIERDHPNLLRSYTELNPGTAGDGIRIPVGGTPIVVNDLVSCGVRFAEGRSGQLVATHNIEQAELVAAIAQVGPRGRSLFVPREPETAVEVTARLRDLVNSRLQTANELIQDRTSDPDLIERSLQRVVSSLVSGVARPRRGNMPAS